MKLNHDCVRSVLLYLEENLKIGTFIQNYEVQLEGFTKEDVDYTLIKLIEANYIVGEYTPYFGGDYDIDIRSITWSGHKFLDNVRDDVVWSETKKAASKFSSVSIDILSSIAINFLTSLLMKQI